MPNNAFSILSFVYNIFVVFTFISKEKIKTEENKIYKYLLIFNSLNIISVLLCWFTIMLRDRLPLINDIISKIVLIFYTLWVLVFTLYVFYITYNNNEEKFNKKYKMLKKILTTIAIISSLIIIYLPIKYYSNATSAYSFGPSANVVYILTGLCMFIWTIMCLLNIKKLKNKKYLPVLILIVFLIISTLIQKINPIILLTTAVESFVTVIMFFTIENPDMKMVQEFSKNNEMLEQTYIDKSNFLFEITEEVKNPINNIKEIIKDTNKKNYEDNIKKINVSLKELDFVVNDVLNVNTLDVQKVKFINNRYKLESLYTDIVERIKNNIDESVTLRTNISNIDSYLYGDSIKLKQVLYSILMNSVKKTEQGFIEFNVDTIEKYDVVRLIFTIKDSGSGMSIDKINDILSITNEFAPEDIEMLEKSEFNIKLCQKIIKSLGGNLLIKSKIDKGTEVILTIDQKKEEKKEDSILIKYENTLSNKKVAIVSQDKETNKIIEKRLKKDKIITSIFMYGGDIIDKIKSGKEYSYIILEDDMKEMNGYTTLKNIREINKYIPIIIILKESKYKIKEQYIKDGFNDYILYDNIEEELNKIIEKY